MKLLVVRHAIAEEREVFAKTGLTDDLRPLTQRGRERMELGARGLASIAGKLDILATSPFTRAAETAAILSAAYGGLKPVPVGALEPGGDYEQLASWLKALGDSTRVAIVGHEPHLSGFVSRLVGTRGSLLQLKKGAACLLTVAPSVGQGSGVLRWALTPSQLRRLGKSADD